jgi:hypothetical protein
VSPSRYVAPVVRNSVKSILEAACTAIRDENGSRTYTRRLTRSRKPAWVNPLSAQTVVLAITTAKVGIASVCAAAALSQTCTRMTSGPRRYGVTSAKALPQRSPWSGLDRSARSLATFLGCMVRLNRLATCRRAHLPSGQLAIASPELSTQGQLVSQGPSKFCWLRLKRHRFRATGRFNIAGGPFVRGPVVRCIACGYETVGHAS